MKTIRVKKGQVLQQKGDLNSKIYFVQSGLLRSYSIDNKGKEHIYMFAPENWTIGDSVQPKEPAELFIDALEDSILHVRDKNLENEKFEKVAIVRRLAVLQRRIITLMSATAIQRYEQFLETYPDIAQRVPQRMIASYLGVTPETLSAAKSSALKSPEN
ncbi:MAG: Crp/Fnr family transcriptional regulator [Bacteroidota bacterium]